jgi:hypothetical protein
MRQKVVYSAISFANPEPSRNGFVRRKRSKLSSLRGRFGGGGSSSPPASFSAPVFGACACSCVCVCACVCVQVAHTGGDAAIWM